MAAAITRAYRSLPPPATLARAALLVFVSAYGCMALTIHMERLATIWVANAILLSFVLKHPRRHWAAILAAGFAGDLAANLLGGDAPVQATFFAICNLVEVIAIALPLRLLRLDREFSRPRSLIAFYALALGPAAASSAALSALYSHLQINAPFVQTALNWYGADALGLTIFVPPLMTVTWATLREMFRPQELGMTLLLIGVVIGVALLNFLARQVPVAFLFFPAVILLTFKRGFAGGTVGLIITATYMIAPVLLGDVSVALRGHPMREQMMVVQIFVAVTALSVVLVGSALDELRRLAGRLASAIAAAESAREEAVVARDAAVSANRAKSMFLANMSHELRTPLNAVIGFSELMHGELFGPLGDERYRDYSGRIQEAGRHLLDLISDILDMSKIEAGKMELELSEFSLDRQIRDCLGLMQDRASQSGVELAADLPPGTLIVHADSRAIRQIVLNLLSNAIKFTPSGGRVVARARIVDGMALFSVRDTGIGIPEERIDDLGNPFVQLRGTAGQTHEGTGLGLALVRTLSEMHGGSMRIDSVQGRGTTITVSFPALARSALAA